MLMIINKTYCLINESIIKVHTLSGESGKPRNIRGGWEFYSKMSGKSEESLEND